jgi:uncharacterized protein DUF3303
MALYVAEHRHPAEPCPAGNPQMAPSLLKILSAPEAAKHSVKIHGEAVARGQHHLYLVADGADEAAVRTWLAPFGQAGSLEVIPASHCEEVVAAESAEVADPDQRSRHDRKRAHVRRVVGRCARAQSVSYTSTPICHSSDKARGLV